jgi:hypothetical protein
MPTPDTPQLLLEHHLKALRLLTILHEYDKVLGSAPPNKWTSLATVVSQADHLLLRAV